MNQSSIRQRSQLVTYFKYALIRVGTNGNTSLVHEFKKLLNLFQLPLFGQRNQVYIFNLALLDLVGFHLRNCIWERHIEGFERNLQIWLLSLRICPELHWRRKGRQQKALGIDWRHFYSSWQNLILQVQGRTQHRRNRHAFHIGPTSSGNNYATIYDSPSLNKYAIFDFCKQLDLLL